LTGTGMGSGLPQGTTSVCMLSVVGPLLLWLGLCVVRLMSCRAMGRALASFHGGWWAVGYMLRWSHG